MTQDMPAVVRFGPLRIFTPGRPIDVDSTGVTDAIAETGITLSWADCEAALREHAAHTTLDFVALRYWLAELYLDMTDLTRATGARYNRVQVGNATPSDLAAALPWLQARREYAYGPAYQSIAAWAEQGVHYAEGTGRDSDRELYSGAVALVQAASAPLSAAPATLGDDVTTRPLTWARIPRIVRCHRCGHAWTPRTPHPKRCPNVQCQAWFSWPETAGVPLEVTAGE